ncbi:hypothetical protein C5S42_09310 [Candidatus Methanomarinus sp.]|nr:hypothetical protein C5S42_09310 [ANME-2 cluster archaeon]
MQKTEWKSVTEIEYILRDFQKICIHFKKYGILIFVIG